MLVMGDFRFSIYSNLVQHGKTCFNIMLEKYANPRHDIWAANAQLSQTIPDLFSCELRISRHVRNMTRNAQFARMLKEILS